MSPAFFECAPEDPGMKSVQKGLRAGELEKDVYDRLVCATCGDQLATENDPDEIGQVRRCPECGTAWQQL